MTKQDYDALGIPPAARTGGGVEVLRAAIVGQNLAMSLRRSFDDPAVWGALLATAARHVAQIYASETGASEDAVRERIRAMFEAEMNAKDDPGTVTAVR